jgi:hypothetical protein
MPQVARSSRAVDSLYGELAERQGIAVLTRRDRKVAQVRSLHSPPTFAASPRKLAAVARAKRREAPRRQTPRTPSFISRA